MQPVQLPPNLTTPFHVSTVNEFPKGPDWLHLSGKREKHFNVIVVDLDKNQVLLGIVLKDDFASGKLCPFNGKIERSTALDVATKALEDGAKITATDLAPIGNIMVVLHNKDNQVLEGDVMEVEVFRATSWTGEVDKTEIMEPKWFNPSEIPYDDMFPDDKYWLPSAILGKRFVGRADFNMGSELELRRSWFGFAE